ncbi:MAG TPA: TraB/GumN family protein [Kofleriaceae bacterium]|nr:TraB/GumN family protein [Kofleriaceae bacterium]
MGLRRATALAALLVAAASCQQASDPTRSKSAPPAQHATDPLPHPLLWSIEKDGHTSYALGTMHVGVDPEARLPDVVWDKLDRSRAFAMETDLADPALRKELAERDDGGSLHADLGDGYWHKLERALTPPVAARIDHFRPTIPVTLLSMRGFPQTEPMDGVLLGRAQQHREQIVYLEPASTQAALLVKWMDVRALEAMLDDLDASQQLQQDALAAYLAGDDARMLALDDRERAEWIKLGRSEAEYDQMMKEMLYDRNASWLPAIERAHAAGGVFLAVGALHLIGKRSVLDLLRQAGYTVTRL